jgi:hypothetical protein
METVLVPASSKQASKPRPLTFESAAELVWESACEAAILTFLVLIFGSIALGFVSSIWRDMAPALPPLVTSDPSLEAEPSSKIDFRFFRQHRYALIFAAMFIGIAAGRLLKYTGTPKQQNAATWVEKAFRRISEQWFKLIVINALLALVGAMILQATQQVSFIHVLWNIFRDSILAVIQLIANAFPATIVNVVEIQVAWYKANELKFIFWLLYIAAICDDLGLPNYKTIGRYLSRRFFKRQKATTTESGRADY